ncbi:23S rRNA (uracil-5-)-methyltransferase RumA [Aphanomyces invadans]|uniref:23S rRNA (Uracil-5-)-methyltransferase RumA n=1 Tax=Aphanomyces invadans TaxID=157072 RepID=A0A024U7Q0_9STRA|nr:23S rRNA (uracil-5-)-methyltransferase RumA [Aphanomyces invadans]ETW02436.1 23S rRNA (uracil-5-)-methyltransferase RumA [Aphanomyces invadans]|eukprot:XP_008869041.1 23S rRNA (uracil-5-)-methyltransferase RumA [Aphanomyces invadans]
MGNGRKPQRNNKRKAADAGDDVSSPSKEDECKVIVMNFGAWKTKKDLEIVLSEHNHVYKAIQKLNKSSFGFIVYESKEERDTALDVLSKIDWMNSEKLEVKPALAKRSLKPMRVDPSDDSSTAAKTVMDAVTPWRNVPYAEQLERKDDAMKKVLVRIVRQTRKEYMDKQKRVSEERKRLRKLQGVATLDEVVGGPSEVIVPSWLDSTGSLYLLTPSGLYAQSLQSEDAPWVFQAKADGFNGLISFASDLIATNTDGLLYTFDTDARTWSQYSAAPAVTSVTAMASFRGHLVCATSDGQILKRVVDGQRADATWVPLASLDVAATAITVHQSFFYATLADGTWKRAPLTADATEALVFDTCPFSHANVTGMTSHDAKLIVVLQEFPSARTEIVFLNDDGITRAKKEILLENSAQTGAVVGFASHKGLCCSMKPITPSPALEGYRNKCEFSCGYDADRKPIVGFRFGTYKDGLVSVGGPDDCVNVPASMKAMVKTFQEFLNQSELPVYDVTTHEGVWRLLTIRASVHTKEVMVCVQANPSSLDETTWEAAKSNVVAAMTSKHAIASFFVQEYTGVSAPEEDHPVVHVYGKTQIEEELLGLRFRISANAFFQVNTPGAEALYSLVREYAAADDKTQVYDVCCGTGTIGLCLAADAGKIVGIELCKAATDDAAANATINGISNATFVNAKAEDVMKEVLRKPREGNDLRLERAVAVVDPPRAGLHIKVLRALRAFRPVTRIVYVSCNPTGSLVENAATLCGPETSNLKGAAFKPVAAAPVDMFPHTEHCEMIIVFERQSN